MATEIGGSRRLCGILLFQLITCICGIWFVSKSYFIKYKRIDDRFHKTWTNYLLIDQVKCKSIYTFERYSIHKFHYLFIILLKSRSFIVTYSYAKKLLD